MAIGFAVLFTSSASSRAQDAIHVSGSGMIGDEILPTSSVGGNLVASVPNVGAHWITNGGEGITGGVSSSLTSPTFTVPVAGDVTLSFTHRYNFEDDGTTRWDGAAVFISVNGGAPTYVDGSAFSQNGYDGFGPGGDGRTITGESPPIGAAAPDGKFGFNNMSPGFASGTLIESIANLGAFAPGDEIAVSFIGAWDQFFVQPPEPSWEIGSVTLTDGADAPISDIDFMASSAGYAVSNVGGVAKPWSYDGDPVIFEIDGNTLAADRYVADIPGGSTFIDLNGASLVVSLFAGTLEAGDTFDLFDGGLIQGNYSSLTLPDGQWDLSGLAPGGDGSIMYTGVELSGFLVRVLDFTGYGGFENVDNLPEAENFLANTGTANLLIEGDRTEVRPVLDFAGGSGSYGVDLQYPAPLPLTYNEHFVLEAKAMVTIPAGTWSIAFASDDGGSLTVDGVDFATGSGGGESRFGEDAAPVRPRSDSVRFEAPRGHAWTGGTFVLNAPLTTTITVVTFDQGTGDSLELAFRDASGGITNNPESGTVAGWSLVADGVNGWTVRTGTTVSERGEAIHVGGLNSTRVGAEIVERDGLRNAILGPSAVTPGLTEEWWNLPTIPLKDYVDVIADRRLPLAGPFKGTDGGGSGTWWTGSGNAIPGILAYPPVTAAVSRDIYITRLTGEILIPESGTIRFKDGVDDFTYLAIDLNGNGILGEADDGTGQSEVLINDNTWADVETGGNGGSPIAARTFTVDAPEGEWLAMEFATGEGGGGDAGVLYWDYDVNGGGLGAGVGFPTLQTDNIDLAANGANLLIPESNLRSELAPLVSAEIVASLGGSLPYEFEIASDGSYDTLTVQNPDASLYSTVVDIEGANLKVLFTGEEPSPGTVADLIDGPIEGNYASLELPPGNWDTSGLAPGGNGTVIFLSGIPFAITDISYDAMANTATFTFNSKADHFYAVDYLGDGYFWNEITDSEASMGATTTYTDTTIPADTPSRIYRVRDLGVLP